MAQVIAIINHKGGCGKTTSTINLGAALAEDRGSTLLIDLDAQANLTLSLKINPSQQQHTIANALADGGKLQPIEVCKNLYVEPANTNLLAVDGMLAQRENRGAYALKKLLEPLQTKYKYILLDCPPALGTLTLTALTAANSVYVPLQSQYLAMQGLAKLQEVVGTVQGGFNPSLVLGGVFLTQYDGRKVLHKKIKALAEQQLGSTLCSTVIRDNVALAEAPVMGQTIFQYEPASKGAADYRELAREIEYRVQHKRK